MLASHHIGVCFGVAKCADISFKRGKMVKKERTPGASEQDENHEVRSERDIYKTTGVDKN